MVRTCFPTGAVKSTPSSREVSRTPFGCRCSTVVSTATVSHPRRSITTTESPSQSQYCLINEIPIHLVTCLLNFLLLIYCGLVGVVAQISDPVMTSPAAGDSYIQGLLTGGPSIFSLFMASCLSIRVSNPDYY